MFKALGSICSLGGGEFKKESGVYVSKFKNIQRDPITPLSWLYPYTKI
jgi:hypothetical protein